MQDFVQLIVVGIILEIMWILSIGFHAYKVFILKDDMNVYYSRFGKTAAKLYTVFGITFFNALGYWVNVLGAVFYFGIKYGTEFIQSFYQF